jgi:hypothetical protein
MRVGWPRYLLALFAALFFAHSAMAAVRVCGLQMTGQQHAPMPMFDPGGSKNLCPEASREANCIAHFSQIYSSDEQTAPSGARAISVAPPRFLHRVWFPVGLGRFIIASASSGVNPSLTILFGNLRI